MESKVVKKEFNKRSNYFLLLILYFIIFIFLFSIKAIFYSIKDINERKSFKLLEVKIDSLANNYGSGRGTYNVYIKSNNIQKIVTFEFGSAISNEVELPTKILILDHPSRKYVYYFDSNIWDKKIRFLIFRVVYIFLCIPIFYFVRKQHLKVKRLAPYGVDEDFNPLPKPAEKINFNKYD